MEYFQQTAQRELLPSGMESTNLKMHKRKRHKDLIKPVKNKRGEKQSNKNHT